MDSSYQNAPACKMLATHCAVCARPLLDSVSVEAGMGPICRERYGIGTEGTEEHRRVANRLVYEIALNQKGDVVVAHVVELHRLGFETLANVIAKRLDLITIREEGDRLLVHTPYQAWLTGFFRAIAGRRWDKERKVNSIPKLCKAQLWEVLHTGFQGKLAIGPKGLFRIPARSN